MDTARSSANRIAQKEQTNLNMSNVFSGDTADGLCSAASRCSPKNISRRSDKGAASAGGGGGELGQNSVASFGSVLGHHARSLVGSFGGCNGIGSGSLHDGSSRRRGGRGISPDSKSSYESKSNPTSVVSGSDGINGSSRKTPHLLARRGGQGTGAGGTDEFNYPLHRMGSRDI